MIKYHYCVNSIFVNFSIAETFMYGVAFRPQSDMKLGVTMAFVLHNNQAYKVL